MTLTASVALLTAGIALVLAAMSTQFARAPGWRDQRYFTIAALAVTAYTTLNLPTHARVLPDEAVIICSRLQIAAAALHDWAWLRYTSAMAGSPTSSRTNRLLTVALVLISLVGISTPLLVHGAVRTHAVGSLEALYRTPTFTLAGELAWAAILACLLVPIARLARAWRRRVDGAGMQLLALTALLLMGINDALIVSRVYDGPYLVDLGFLFPLAAVGYSFTSRFVADARALASLRAELERQVSERTAELSRAQAALHRAEKLAALGQFAAGVAHEVNNPSAVVSASLQYLEEAEADSLSKAGRDSIREALQSVRRISAIVRQLLDAGRLASSSEPTEGVELQQLGDSALLAARARMGRRVAILNQLPPGVFASGQESVLVQVLVNLVVNAVQAVPELRTDGRVVMRAEVELNRVLLVVEDNGIGMSPEVLERVFEPFFTTKPFGSGTGLGLAVSRGLITGIGGDLRIESQPGVGTRAVVELARVDAPTRAPASSDSFRPGVPSQRLLLIDDEPTVVSSLRRLLEQRYRVEVASGVDDGLRRLEAGAFDIVLCDVMMPAGGGERFYSTLLATHPTLARRVVFLTGGAVTEGTRQFLRDQPQPVLGKPLVIDELARAAESISQSDPSSSLH
jgi:signal transduction histidine kinase/ActR/RegA family two-component response regulator